MLFMARIFLRNKFCMLMCSFMILTPVEAQLLGFSAKDVRKGTEKIPRMRNVQHFE